MRMVCAAKRKKESRGPGWWHPWPGDGQGDIGDAQPRLRRWESVAGLQPWQAWRRGEGEMVASGDVVLARGGCEQRNIGDNCSQGKTMMSGWVA